jgi:hypothetical protein
MDTDGTQILQKLQEVGRLNSMVRDVAKGHRPQCSRRFGEWSWREPGDIDGRPEWASKRERASQPAPTSDSRRLRIRPTANLLSSSPPRDGLAAASWALTFWICDACSFKPRSERLHFFLLLLSLLSVVRSPNIYRSSTSTGR